MNTLWFCLPSVLFLFLLSVLGGPPYGENSEDEIRRIDSCLMPFDTGYGEPHEFISRWYYQAAQDRCLGFTYHGHGGNRNNFERKDYCRWFCLAGYGKLNTYRFPNFPGPNTTGILHGIP